eukprot:CAMPEP_0194283356 /NCGR_PEP_ID=MMETSP0169-20130528/25182_1 /TAXON_ID=218684 /ORGANISM="Corethron pennatum, Strain L29A3" /LENGTH=248 /DNA_ID=CAMNT_0039028931 /DNA_START=74 /DNA_END=817 /DNA_ORIENTATION=+
MSTTTDNSKVSNNNGSETNKFINNGTIKSDDDCSSRNDDSSSGDVLEILTDKVDVDADAVGTTENNISSSNHPDSKPVPTPTVIHHSAAETKPPSHDYGPAPSTVTLHSPKLFVAGLHSCVLDIHLTKLFSPYGSVSRAVVISGADDHGSAGASTRRSKGYGFVEMGSVHEARAAMNAINGRILLRKKLVVKPARPSTTGGASSGGGLNSSGRSDETTATVKNDDRNSIDAKIMAVKRAINNNRKTRK